MVLAPFAVAEDDDFGTRIQNHCGRHVTGESTVFGMMTILRAHADLLYFLVDRVDQREWRGQRDLYLHQALRGAVDRARFRQHRTGAVHFPIANNIGSLGHMYFLNSDLG